MVTLGGRLHRLSLLSGMVTLSGRLHRLSLLSGMVTLGGRLQPGEGSEGTGRARLCAYVKFSTLNSAIEQELRDRRVEDSANATSSA